MKTQRPADGEPSSGRPEGPAQLPRVSRRRAAVWSLVLAYVIQGVAFVKGVVLVPLYLRYFGLDLYGAWLASASIVAILGLMELGLSTVFYQQLAHAHGADDKTRFAKLVGSGGLCTLGLVPLVMGPAWALATFVPRMINASPSTHHTLAITFLLVSGATALNLAQTNVIAVTHAWQLSAVGGLGRLAGQLVEVAVLFVCLTRGMGLVSLGVGALVGACAGLVVVVATVASLWARHRLPRPKVERVVIRELLMTGGPVALSRAASHIASNIEIALVSALVSPASAAIYGLTEKSFRVALGFVNPIAGSVLSPLAHLIGERGEAAAKQPLRELTAVWAAVVAVVFPTLLVINRDFISLWVGADKYGGFWLTCAVCANMVVGARLFLVSITLMAVGEITRTAWGSLVEPALRIPLMVLGLRTVGSFGIPLAAAVGGGVLAFGVFPRLLARKAGLSGKEGAEVQFAGHLAVAACVVCGALGALWAPQARTWAGLVVQGSVATVAMAGLALGTSRPIRRMVLARLPRRT